MRTDRSTAVNSALVFLFILASATCSAFGASFTIGGKVTGLKTGDSVTLENGTVLQKVSANGTFAFTAPLASGTKYDVTVHVEPTGETCTIANPKGTVLSKVTDIDVTCGHTIGGEVTGLKGGDSVILENEGGDALTVTASGKSVSTTVKFTFTTAVLVGGKYDVTIKTQPKGQTCIVQKPSGTVGSSNITTVEVTCGYTIGGALTGLKTGDSVTLEDKSGDELKLTGNVKFVFKTPTASGLTYSVKILTEPKGETCSIAHGSGTVAAANVTNILVTCAAPTFSISGAVSGLSSTATSITLKNGSATQTVTFPGTSFSFTGIPSGSAYAVTVVTPPTGESCSVSSNGSGSSITANITGVTVTCTVQTFSISGAVSGLSSTASSIILKNGSATQTVTFPGTGFSFTGIPSGSAYAVTVVTPPTGETCTVSGNGSGSSITTNITGVAVSCSVPTFSISGSIAWPSSGVNSSDYIMLQNGSATQTVVYPNTSFIFTGIPSGSAYDVTIVQPPSDENCSVSSNGSGSSITADISGVTVTCLAETYSISGTVSGLTSTANSITLKNGTATQTVTYPSTSFSFTGIPSGSSYAVTVVTPPTGETCSVSSNGSGSSITFNITGVTVTCTTSGGGGGGAAYWIPYALLPLTGATPAGPNGLLLVPSDKLATNPTPVQITTDPVQPLGIGINVSSSNGVVTYSPQVEMYADTSTSKDGTTQTTQIYGITLAGTSTTPTPVQIGSFSLVSTMASPQLICGAIAFETDYSNAESLFAVIETSDTIEDCYDDKNALFQVVHYQDSPSTAPVTVTINTLAISSLYQSGMLTGLLLFDSTNNALDVYADDTFTSPKQLITGISGASYEAGSANGADNSTAEAFFQVATVATKSTPSSNYLYRIDGSTQAATQIQDLGAGGVAGVTVDDTNLYYIDSTTSVADETIADLIYQVALTGGTPTLLYTAPTISIASGSPTEGYQLIGTNDSVLAFEFYSEPLTNMYPDPTKESATLYTIPIGTNTTTPTTLASYPAGKSSGNLLADVFLAAPSGSGASGNILFATVSNNSGSQFSPTIAYSAVSIPLNGGTAATPIANSIYSQLEGVASSGQFYDRVWQVTGITDTNGGYGGGTANIADVATLADTPLTTVGGVNYVFPAGFSGTLSAISSNNIAVGAFANTPAFEANPAGGLLQSPVAADLTSNFLWTGTAVTNSIVFPY